MGLHYNSPYQANSYVQAIQAIGNILSNYDSDQRFPAYGFGAKLPSGDVSHCFALNGLPQTPSAQGWRASCKHTNRLSTQ